MTAPDTASLIEGGFTYESLPDLFRYLCGRGESLFWVLSTLAGTFEVTIHSGLPVDVILRPQRMVGAKVGVNAALILFRQQGGRFSVSQDVPALSRPASLSGTCENLLIELATLDDERGAPGATRSHLRSVVSDRSADMQFVVDIAPINHQTAFQASSTAVPLTDVLQLFSVSRVVYRVSLLKEKQLIGTLQLRSGEVMSAECWPLLGARAFSTLISYPETLTIDVRALAEVEETGAAPLGTLDMLLLREVMSGRLGADGPRSRPQKQSGIWEADHALPPERTPNSVGPAVSEATGSQSDLRPFWQRVLGRQRRS